MTSFDRSGSHFRHAETSWTSEKSSKPSRTPSGPIATNYRETLFRSRLEARWAAFFDLAGVEWEYEPKASIRGWWPDFLVKGILLGDKRFSALAEVKPVAFSPIAIDPAYAKALHQKWTLLLGGRPEGDYVGVLACNRDEELRTIAVRLTDEGLAGGPVERREYGAFAEVLWGRTSDKLPNAGVSAAINKALEAFMGKSLFHFEKDRA